MFRSRKSITKLDPIGTEERRYRYNLTLKHISYSYLHLSSCPYATFLRYEAGIKGPTTPWLALGNAVHYGLEKGYGPDGFSLEAGIDLFLEEFRRIIDEDEVFISWPQVKKLEAEGSEMIGGFYAKLQSNEVSSTPLALEKEFRIPFGGIEVIGRIDRIDTTSEGKIIIADYKSGRRKPDEWYLRHHYQLTCYAWACLYLYNELPEKLIWYQLRTGEQIETVRTMEDILDLQKVVENVIWMSNKGIRHRAFNENVCGMCDYSGFAKMGGRRPPNPICDDHALEEETLERLGLT